MMTKDELRLQLAASKQCFHQLKFEDDLYAPGITPYTHLLEAIKFNHIPDVSGKTVLDIGAWDGFYSFYCEEHGAKHVTAIDNHVWERADLATDIVDFNLPGKKIFDLYHKYKGSKVESVYENFLEWEPRRTFDVVLFLGVLYHINNPYLAMQKVYDFTGKLLIINTHAIDLPEHENVSLLEFYPFSELNNDRTNWFSPNEKALMDLCRSVGFKKIAVKNKLFHYRTNNKQYYRLIVHAEKD